MEKKQEGSGRALEGSEWVDERKAKIVPNPPQEDINRGFSAEPARIKERVVKHA